ncbi:DUF4124 domain-containing protein [Pseudoxanthomonas wuyuanensis]
MMRSLPLFCLLLLPSIGHADDGRVIYRCTDATGAVTLQNAPCPKGMTEEKKVMQELNTVPMAAAPATPAPARVSAPEPAAQTAPAKPSLQDPQPGAKQLPPPDLFQCTTHDQGKYFTEDSEPAARCAPLRTVGLDGNPQAGAGQACEVRYDQCARVPDEGLCAAWKQRRDAAEVAWRFTRPETADRNKADFERVQRIVSESGCGR